MPRIPVLTGKRESQKDGVRLEGFCCKSCHHAMQILDLADFGGVPPLPLRSGGNQQRIKFNSPPVSLLG